eukprot:TRINITY_DN23564_c0_g1_i1.p1 TRINITY_DN23564_c0_g1~~TRINITY_DN23564_c0_g1_i1.p1  ORF type:complete len:417 (+),score=81.53 TRINITY_DN23564_c0_g1_i1:25-1251(+)
MAGGLAVGEGGRAPARWREPRRRWARGGLGMLEALAHTAALLSAAALLLSAPVRAAAVTPADAGERAPAALPPLEEVRGLEPGAYAVSCPEGFGDFADPGYFEVFGNWQTRYGRDNLRLSEHFLAIFQERVEPVLSEALERCPAFVLETMMNAVLKINTDEGDEVTKAWLLRIFDLQKRALAAATPANRERLRRLEAEWAIDIAAVYPKFLGLDRLGPFGAAPANALAADLRTGDGVGEADPEAAHCQGQKFFVYDLGAEFYRPGTFYCLQGQWGTEVIMHRYLRHTCNTRDPEEADWFYVPLYGTCMYVKLNENVSNDGGTQLTMDQLSDRHIWEPVLEFLKQSKYYHRKQGSDHIFLFADGQGPRIWDGYEAIRSESVFLSPESKCPTWPRSSASVHALALTVQSC